jgi:hypothetical protein
MSRLAAGHVIHGEAAELADRVDRLSDLDKALAFTADVVEEMTSPVSISRAEALRRRKGGPDAA